MQIFESTTDVAATDAFRQAVVRAKAEFLEMPGLKLTADQARRLWAMDAQLCHAILATLVETRFLVKTRNAHFTRAA